jgi:hypothetical protein
MVVSGGGVEEIGRFFSFRIDNVEADNIIHIIESLSARREMENIGREFSKKSTLQRKHRNN